MFASEKTVYRVKIERGTTPRAAGLFVVVEFNFGLEIGGQVGDGGLRFGHGAAFG